MSSRVFQGIILQMRDATNKTVGVIDNEGVVVSCTDLSKIGRQYATAATELELRGEPIISFEGRYYKPLLSWRSLFDYAVFVEGDDELAKQICLITAIALNGAKTFYDEKHDQATYIKNILLDNILPGDIHARARELGFVLDIPRVVVIIRQLDKPDPSIVELISGLFPDNEKDYVVGLSETDVALVKSMQINVEEADLLNMAQAVEETISAELMVKTLIGIGSVTTHLKDLATSYKEAQIAIDVGQVFESERSIQSFESLGIGRLIYQLPTTMCEMFLSEVFKKNSIDTLDQETLFTIQKFFENSLNVSETSRKLFVHRNTLVYRLEKIKKLTGLDLREFDHAIVFKVAMMVKKYLASREGEY